MDTLTVLMMAAATALMLATIRYYEKQIDGYRQRENELLDDLDLSSWLLEQAARDAAQRHPSRTLRFEDRRQP